MSVRILRDATVASLRDSIRDNLDQYRDGSFAFLELDSSQYLELPVVTYDDALANVNTPTDGEAYDIDNCIAVYSYLRDLHPYDARDERLWCYLTHTLFLEYARLRWPIPDDDGRAILHIETHFFARTNRQIERDNAVSRLWWLAHLCARAVNIPLREALEAFLFRADVRANIVERPTVAQSTKVFGVILRALATSMLGEKTLFDRRTFRTVMVELNSIGGFRLFDVLPEQEFERVFWDILTKKVGIAKL